MNTGTNGKLLGIDYGTKWVGIAVSDEAGKVAFPKDVLENSGELTKAVVELVQNENIAGVVLGESKNHQGEDNAVMEDIREFKAELEKQTDVPVHFELEFMTSQQARRSGDESVDAKAAALILQSFIDKKSVDSK